VKGQIVKSTTNMGTMGPLEYSLRRFIGGHFPGAPLLPRPFQYLMLLRLPFGTWVHIRRMKFALLSKLGILKSISTNNISDGLNGHIENQVIPHNQKQIWRITRHRTEKIINVLRSIDGLKKSQSKILCVGPRNEAELLLFKLYGFSLKNIVAIDLFSYSPWIQIMDMHDLKFKDSSFDLLYSSYVVRYSSNLQKAVDETIRVVKNNGLVVIGFVNGPKQEFVGSELNGGISEVLSYFKNHVGHIYWREESPVPDSSGKVCTVVFQLKK
jgi:hypothetical protein